MPHRPELESGLMMLIKEGQNGDTLQKLSRYEAGLMNAVTRTLGHLHLLQADRNALKLVRV